MSYGEREQFIERLSRLAGETTYRVPVAGRGTKVAALPDPHAIASALAFARMGPDDIGPDVAYCWVLQNNAYRARVVRRLATALRCHEFRHASGEDRLGACETAWDALIWNHQATRPADAPRCWDRLILASIGTLETSAWDALAEAERRYRKAG